MMMTWPQVDALAQTHGNSFFVLDDAKFRANFTRLIAAFDTHYPHTRIGYSYKTNYTPHLCRIVHELGGYAEVVSGMEYALAKRLDVPGNRIIFNGPYKAEDAFADAALSGATLNLDSLRDTAMLRDLAAAHPDRQIGAVIRCNFALSTDDISRFGMDVDGSDFRDTLTLLRDTPNLSLTGLHCHFPDRDLASFGRRAERMIVLSQSLFPDAPPQTLNIGGGYFSDMPDSLRQSFDTPPATFEDYGALVGGIMARAYGGHPTPPKLFLEPGTAVVADTQHFYTRVISTKTIRGKNFATVAGSIFDISPTARSRNLPITAICSADRPDDGTYFDIVGFTCIEKDILSEALQAPLAVGDFIGFANVGSYSVVMKPPFILPANPILVATSDGHKVIKRRETPDDIFQNFVF